MSDSRPIVYPEGDNWIYRASGSGSCVKYLVAAALGYEEQRGKKWDDLLSRSAAEGNIHEAAMIETLREAGLVGVNDQQEEVNVQVIPGVYVRGHIEGILEFEGEQQLFEMKTMSTKQFTKWVNGGFERFPRYASQLACYMQAYPDLDVRYIVKRREDGFISEQIIPAGEPPIPFSLVRKKIVVAEKWRRQNELPPCDVPSNLQWNCPVWYLHDEDEETEDDDPLTDEMEEILGELVTEYLELKGIEEAGKEAEKKRKKINPEILNMLGKLDQRKVKFAGKEFQVTRVRSGGTRIDKAKLKEMIGEDRMEEVETKYRYQYPKIRAMGEGEK